MSFAPYFLSLFRSKTHFETTWIDGELEKMSVKYISNLQGTIPLDLAVAELRLQGKTVQARTDQNLTIILQIKTLYTSKMIHKIDPSEATCCELFSTFENIQSTKV